MNRFYNRKNFIILLLIFLVHGFTASAGTYLSFSPHPERIKIIDRVLDPLDELIFSTDITNVFINIPVKFRNNVTELYDEDYLANLKKCLDEKYSGKVIINRFKPDLGPISKLLPAIYAIRSDKGDIEESKVLTIDDDYAYSPKALRHLIAARTTGTSVDSFGGNSMSYWIKKDHKFPNKVASKIKAVSERSPVDLIEGWAAVAYRLSDIPPQRAEIMSELATKVSKDCYLSDDLVISFALALGNIKKNRLASNPVKQDIDPIAVIQALKNYIKKDASNLSCNFVLRQSIKDRVKAPTILKDKENKFFLIVEGVTQLPITFSEEEGSPEIELKKELSALKFIGQPTGLRGALCKHIKDQYSDVLPSELDAIKKIKQDISIIDDDQKKLEFFRREFPNIEKLTKHLLDKSEKPLNIQSFYYESFLPKDIICDYKLDTFLREFKIEAQYAVEVKNYLMSALQDYAKAKERGDFKNTVTSAKFMRSISENLLRILSGTEESGFLVGTMTQTFMKQAPKLIEDNCALQNGSGYSCEEKSLLNQDNPEKARIENSKYELCLDSLVKIAYSSEKQGFISEAELLAKLREMPTVSFFE